MHDDRGNAELPPARTPAQSPSEQEIRTNLKSLLSSNIFSSATRSSRFLQYVVEESLAGKEEAIKEGVLGFEVFDRVRDFDPRLDAIVRVEATKLRLRLERYYQGEGSQATVEIEIPKGTYVPRFSIRPAASAATDSSPDPEQIAPDPIAPQPISAEPEPAPSRRFGLNRSLTAAALLAVIVTSGYYIRRRQTPPPLPPGNVKSIAVLPFINLSSDAENVRKSGRRLRITAQTHPDLRSSASLVVNLRPPRRRHLRRAGRYLPVHPRSPVHPDNLSEALLRRSRSLSWLGPVQTLRDRIIGARSTSCMASTDSKSMVVAPRQPLANLPP
jgi:hypothetical protein